MSILGYVVFIGIISIIYGLIWKLLASAILIPLFLLGIEKFAILVKAFGYYILVSLIAMLTLYAIQANSSIGHQSIVALILFPIVGVFTIFVLIAGGIYEGRKEAKPEFKSYWKYEEILLIIAIILFIVALFVPVIVVNPISVWLFEVVLWVYGLKIIGSLVAIGGILFSVYVMLSGIFLIGMLMASLVRKLKSL